MDRDHYVLQSFRHESVHVSVAPLDSDLDALRDKAKRIAEKVEVY